MQRWLYESLRADGSWASLPALVDFYDAPSASRASTAESMRRALHRLADEGAVEVKRGPSLMVRRVLTKKELREAREHEREERRQEFRWLRERLNR